METLKRNGYFASLLSEAQFQKLWPQIEGSMDLIPHTWEDLTKESVVYRALNRSLQVWGVGDELIEMVLFTQLAHYATGSVLQVIWGAGEGKIYEKAGDAVDASLEYFAITQECKRIDIIGRGGWERILKPRGFKRAAVVLSRNVVHKRMQ